MTEQNNLFAELAKIDVGKYIEKKGKFSYLSWTYAVDTLRKHAPDATWRVVRFDGMPYLKTECGYFVEVAVTVNGIELSQIHPVLDNNNRPIASPNAFQINTSIQRGLVKSIALHGLGLYIYAGEDLPEVDGENDIPAKTTTTAKSTTKATGTSATNAEPSAREKAIEEAKAKAEAKKAEAAKVAGEEAKKEQAETPVGAKVEASIEEPSVEPINKSLLVAIGNMLKLVVKKKGERGEVTTVEDYTTELLGKFGKASLEELTFDQGKEVVAELNVEVRKQ